MGVVRLKKNIMRTGTFQNQNGMFTITAEQLDKWAATFAQMLADGVVCPIVKDHDETVDKAVGKVVSMERDGEYLTAVLEFPNQQLANLTLTNDVSVKAQSEYPTGVKTYRDAIRHVSLTPLPLIPGLGEYDLVCSVNDCIDNKTQTKGTDMKKILERIAQRLDVEIPDEALEEEKAALEWLDKVLDNGKDEEASNTDSEDSDEDSEEDDSDETDDDKPGDSEEGSGNKKKKGRNVKACGKACEKKKAKNVKASGKSNDDTEDEDDSDNEDSDDDDSDEEEDEEDDSDEDDVEASAAKKSPKKKKEPKIDPFEGIKTEKDLEERSKNIVASINATRQTQLQSYLGRPGISAQKIEAWVGKFAQSTDLNICCSLQSEFDTLIEGLGCAALSPSVLEPNPKYNGNQSPTDEIPDGPQFSKWKEKMARRKGVK